MSQATKVNNNIELTDRRGSLFLHQPNKVSMRLGKNTTTSFSKRYGAFQCLKIHDKRK